MPSLHAISLPVFSRAFANLSKNLDKARAWADANGVAHQDLLAARLYPDMLPLTGQVQRASDSARFVAVRVAGTEPKPMADDEKTFDDLQARIAATRAYIDGVPASAFEGKEAKEVVLKFGGREVPFTAESYILTFALPNFFFHAATAYGIMRHKGVPLGKIDFLTGG